MVDETVNNIIRILEKEYPDVKIALHHSNPLELLVSTILSAQCTDKRVNEVTGKLFEKYRTVQDYANVPQEELEKDIYSTGFYRNKAKNIGKLSTLLIQDFNSQVPDNMKDLVTLPGVARKTANVVLSNAFGKIEGIAVDTHVKRLSFRLGLTDNTNPEKIETDLMAKVSKSEWGIITLLLIHHGRRVCKSRKPLCGECALNNLCPSAFTFG